MCIRDRFKTWAKNSSPAWFIGIHFYDLIYWLLEEKPVRVYASGLKKKLVSMGIDSYDSLQSKFEFANGEMCIRDSIYRVKTTAVWAVIAS